MASESSVSGYDLDNGSELWRIRLSGTEYLSHAKVRSQVAGMMSGIPENRMSGVMHGSRRMFALALEDRTRTRMILHSLLSRDIADARFHPASAYDKASLARQRSRIIR